MSSTRVTRSSSCGTLNLPPALSCDRCRRSILKCLHNGTKPKKLKKCTQPWGERWKNHRELGKVEHYKKVIAYLGTIVSEEFKENTINGHC